MNTAYDDYEGRTFLYSPSRTATFPPWPCMVLAPGDSGCPANVYQAFVASKTKQKKLILYYPVPNSVSAGSLFIFTPGFCCA